MPPYDDIDVVAGQGTIGMELLRQHTGALDYIFVPVGGGGIIAGITAYIKYLKPEVKVRSLSIMCFLMMISSSFLSCRLLPLKPKKVLV